MDKPKSEFIADVVAAKLEVKHAVLDKVNPHFKSKYASLTAVLDAVVHIYAKYNITFEQRSVQKEDGSWVLKTWRVHSSGQFDDIPDEQPLSGDTPQQQGSSLTYKRRYGLSCVAGIASEEDDDGEAATAGPRKSALKEHEKGDYAEIQKGIRAQTTVDGLKQYWEDNKVKLRGLSPGWLEWAYEEKDRKKKELEGEEAEDSELVKQLKGSLV